MDIISRIDEYLLEVDIKSSVPYISQSNALKIIDLIILEMVDDRVLLNVIRNNIEKNWSQNNLKLLENFYKVMSFYGIIEENKERRTILEAKGKTIVRKFIELKNKEKILSILCK